MQAPREKHARTCNVDESFGGKKPTDDASSYTPSPRESNAHRKALLTCEWPLARWLCERDK
jgi:hypothetical protein